MRRSYWLAAAGAVALSMAAGAAQAQSAGNIRIGAETRGTLAAGDAVADEDAYIYDDYRFTARAGQRLEAILRSEDFDAYLAIYADGAEGEPLASDDDGLGEGVNSRLRFTPEVGGTYVLRARTLGGVEGGAYTLSLRERPRPPRAPRPGSIRLGQTVRGDIGGRDAEDEDGGRYDAWAFRGSAGDRVAVTLNSDDFDPIVRIGRMNGDDFSELAFNDDWGGELNSRLVFTLPESGEYVIRAAPLGQGGEGDYVLALNVGPEPAPATAATIGDEIDGELNGDDGLNEAGQRADAYRFQGTAGQRVSIGLSSDSFDTYLELFSDVDGVRTSLATDDDGAGSGTNSRLLYTLPSDGDYIVEARAFSDGMEGDYTLKIEETAPERAPEALAFGATVQGEIGDDDPRDAQNRGYDAFTFPGVEGQRVQVIMRSGDFDTFLRIGSAEGEFADLASDDDGLGEGTDSRLSFTIPETGDYVLRASPLSANNDGLYSLELIDRGPEPMPGSLLVGEVARGTLSETDANAADGSYFDAYRIEAKDGEVLIITMVSNDLDSFLVIGRETGTGGFTVLASDDDGLSDTHARIEWTVPSDGTFIIRAGSFGQGEKGAYALRVERKS